MSKRIVATLVIGAFVASAALGAVAMAAPPKREVDPAKAAERISTVFHVKQDDVCSLQAKGYSLRDIGRAAFLADASGKSLTNVIQLKKEENTWKDVAQEIGVTKEQLKAERNKITSERIAVRYDGNASQLRTLHEQGHSYGNLAKASYLSQQAQKSVTDVVAMKTDANNWLDVSDQLGLDAEKTKAEFSKMQKMAKRVHKAKEHMQKQNE
jgi:hypothetical protein